MYSAGVAPVPAFAETNCCARYGFWLVARPPVTPTMRTRTAGPGMALLLAGTRRRSPGCRGYMGWSAQPGRGRPYRSPQAQRAVRARAGRGDESTAASMILL